MDFVKGRLGWRPLSFRLAEKVYLTRWFWFLYLWCWLLSIPLDG